MQARWPVNVTVGEVEDYGQRPGTSGPLQLSTKVDLAIWGIFPNGDNKIGVLWVEGLSKVGGKGDDCFQLNIVLVDLYLGRAEEAN